MSTSSYRHPNAAAVLDQGRTRRRRVDWRRRVLALLRSFALTLFLLLIASILVASLFDIARQVLLSDRSSKVADVTTTGGTYVLVAAIGIGIIIRRAITGRTVLSAIPKGYLPTQASDVPKRAHKLISAEYERASVIANISQPKGRMQQGWGRPSTAHENVHFRTAILATIPMMRSILDPLFPQARIEETKTSRTRPLSPLAALHELDPNPMPDALLPLAELYEQHLQRAKYGQQEPTEQAYDEVVKVVAVVVGVLGTQSADSHA
ncbi:hypothetical protein OIO90_001599 [Microbotryomycetes sp. JL221]|nr:hypothetical protein OIO90_001599 [Microbotryomycetes sp. JL221]